MEESQQLQKEAHHALRMFSKTLIEHVHNDARTTDTHVEASLAEWKASVADLRGHEDALESAYHEKHHQPRSQATHLLDDYMRQREKSYVHYASTHSTQDRKAWLGNKLPAEFDEKAYNNRQYTKYVH